MKIEDYVRSKDGKVGKITSILLNEENELYSKFYIDIKGYEDFKFDIDDLKCDPSPYIIDLIEVVDYVNGKKVIEVWEEPFGEFAGQLFTILEGEEAAPTIRDIKSIVTKEQFEAMKYVVGDN